MTDSLYEDVQIIVPVTGTFVLVDDCKLGLTFPDRTVLSFPEQNGFYSDSSYDDAASISEIARVKRMGVQFVVVAWTNFWMFDRLPGFREYLWSQFSCVLQRDHCVAFDMRNHKL